MLYKPMHDFNFFFIIYVFAFVYTIWLPHHSFLKSIWMGESLIHFWEAHLFLSLYILVLYATNPSSSFISISAKKKIHVETWKLFSVVSRKIVFCSI